jgi:23S rRNA pseudouridine1911/1915/1917 synthase
MAPNKTSKETASRFSLTVPLDEKPRRVDAFLAKKLDQHSRSRWKGLIETGCVTVAGKTVKPSMVLEPGAVIEVCEPEPQQSHLLPENIALDLIHEDDDFLVVNKPPGMVVHPAPGNPNGTLVNALLYHVPGLSIGGVDRPGIVHRLDKDTSGVILCAKNDFAHRWFTAQFAERKVEKRYLAFCHGQIKETRLTCITGHRRHPTDRRRYTTQLEPPAEETSEIHSEGQHGAGTGNRMAISDFVLRAHGGGIGFLEVLIKTGRTHQIRAQIADLGHPLLADELYGGGNAHTRVANGPVQVALKRLNRQALHAFHLGVVHPRSKEPMGFSAPLPEDLGSVLHAMRQAKDYSEILPTDDSES